jgi:large subunit ribosomal protein L30e
LDLSKEIRQAVDTGKTLIGPNRALKAVKRGEGKLVILASNCRADVREDMEYYAKLAGISVLSCPMDNIELGLACGKPFSVNVMVVINPGDSNVLSSEVLR